MYTGCAKILHVFLLKEIGFRCAGSAYVRCYICVHVYPQRQVNQVYGLACTLPPAEVGVAQEIFSKGSEQHCPWADGLQE